MTKEQVSATSRRRDLNKSTTNIASESSSANIVRDHAMILPDDATPRRMEFSEGTGHQRAQFYRIANHNKFALTCAESAGQPIEDQNSATTVAAIGRTWWFGFQWN